MKKIEIRKIGFYLVMFLLIGMTSCKNETDEIIPKKQIDLSNVLVRIDKAGTLDSVLTNTINGEITGLKIVGEINVKDFITLRDKERLRNLSKLDLSEATIENNSIPENAFGKCIYYTILGTSYSQLKKRLKNFTFPKSITSIGNYAFFMCDSIIGKLEIPIKTTIIGDAVFYGCKSLSGNLNFPSELKSIGCGAFGDCSGLNGILNIPTTIDSIGYWTFQGCSGFTGDLVIPSEIKSIGQSAFMSCTGFNGNLIISSGVTSIGSMAFYRCSGFNGALLLPSTIKTISNDAFMYCSGFTDLTIPVNLTSISNRAFFGCTGLTSIKSHSIIPPTIGNQTFYQVNKSIPLIVPKGSIDKYKSANYWNEFTTISEDTN